VECVDIREALLAKSQKRLSDDESREFDAHVESCDECKKTATAGGKAVALLTAYRIATDLEPDEEEIASVMKSIETADAARSERVARKAREAPAPDHTKLYVFAFVAIILLGATAFILKETLFGEAPPPPNPVLTLLDEVTDQRRARDFALLLDIQLHEEWSRPDVRHRRIITLALARRLARGANLPDGLGFMKVILTENAATASLRAPDVVFAAEPEDPLSLAGELELVWQFDRAIAECDRVLVAADDETKERARIHKAAMLTLSGRIDEAHALVDPLLPEVTPPAEVPENYEPPMPGMPESFAGKIAWHIEDRIRRAQKARTLKETHQRKDPEESDYRGGELGIRAIDPAFALDQLKGTEEPILVGLLSSAWVHLMRGDLSAARAPMNECFQKAQKRFTRSIAQLGLAEIAFMEGRYYSGLGNLALAQEHAPDSDGPNKYWSLVLFYQAMREFADEGSTPRASSSFKLIRQELEDRGGELVVMIDGTLKPMLAPLAQARDDVTAQWAKASASPFAKIFEPIPGEVRGKQIRMAGFNTDTEGFTATDGGTVGNGPGLLGQGLVVTGAGSRAGATLDLNEPEVEMWLIFAVRTAARGSFSLTARDGDGGNYRWRTHVLAPNTWYRMAVPLGALAPETPGEQYVTILGKQVATVGFEFAAAEGTASFTVDDLMIHAGQAFGDNVDAAPAEQ
jgi:tetratricopeptide (TPR) repeat protein